MSQELSLRQKAIRWKQAGQAVSWSCKQLERSREWFYKWWNHYQSEGARGLRDRSHAPQIKGMNLGASPEPFILPQAAGYVSPKGINPHRWSGEIRQAILDIRDRLMRRRGPRARYRLAGAATIRHELACLGYEPLPSIRTIERML